jgi:hypothetical protein
VPANADRCRALLCYRGLRLTASYYKRLLIRAT